MIKQSAKKLISSMVTRLPWGAREAVFEALCDQYGGPYDTMMRLAPFCNIKGFQVKGQYGYITGAATDSSILRAYSKNGTFAAKVNDQVGAFLKDGGTYLDIGANIGTTTIPPARNPKIQVISFEPEPACFFYLRINVAANSQNDNVTIHQVALFNADTTLDFEISIGNHGDNRIRMNNEPGALGEHRRDSIKVQAKRLDDFLTCTGPLAAKIDTQGAEPYVIEGGRRTLENAGLICLEFWPYGMRRLGGDIASVLDFVAGFPKIAIGKEENEQVTLPRDTVLSRLNDLDPADARAYVDLTMTR